MVALGIVIMGDVQIVVAIVEAEGDLGAVIDIVHRQSLIAGGGVQGVQHRCDGIGIGGGFHILGQRREIGMVRIQAGINDGDGNALAGIAQVPGIALADHGAGGVAQGVAGIGGIQRLILPLQIHLLHAGERLDLADGAVGDLRRHAVDQPGVAVGHGQALPAQDLALDLRDGRCLRLFQHVDLIGGQDTAQLRIAVALDDAVAAELDDDLDHILVRVGLCLGQGVVRRAAGGQVHIDLAAVDLLDGGAGGGFAAYRLQVRVVGVLTVDDAGAVRRGGGSILGAVRCLIRGGNVAVGGRGAADGARFHSAYRSAGHQGRHCQRDSQNNR